MTTPDFIMLDGDRYEFDFLGYLKDFNTWTTRLLDWYAEREGIALTDEHRLVIALLRCYFTQYNALPVARAVLAAMNDSPDRERRSAKYLHTLFPGGIHQAYKMAGLPRLQLSV